MNTKAFGDYLADNWKLVAGAVGAIALVLVGLGVWTERQRGRERSAVNALYQAQKEARTLVEKKQVAEADAALQKVAQEFGGTRAAYEAFVQAGDFYMDAKSFGEAAARYAQAADATKDSFSRVLVRYNLGIAKESGGQFQEAVNAYEEALNVKGSDFLRPEILMAQARCYESLGQKPKALSLYQEVQRSYSNNPYYNNAATALAAQLAGPAATAQAAQ